MLTIKNKEKTSANYIALSVGMPSGHNNSVLNLTAIRTRFERTLQGRERVKIARENEDYFTTWIILVLHAAV